MIYAFSVSEYYSNSSEKRETIGKTVNYEKLS